MNKIFTLLLICVSLLLSACYNKTETTEIEPAQLELNWVQSTNLNNLDKLNELNTAIPPDLAQQLRQIGEYHLSSHIIYTKESTKIERKLIFLREIKSEELRQLLPLLKSAFKENEFQLTFHGAQKKHITRVSYGLFGRESKVTTDSHVIATTKIPGQKPKQP